MHGEGDHYECIAVHADDLLIASKDPKSIVFILSSKYDFKLRGIGPMSYYLGCDFRRDRYGALLFTPRKPAEKIEDYCINIFGSKLKLNAMHLSRKEISLN